MSEGIIGKMQNIVSVMILLSVVTTRSTAAPSLKVVINFKNSVIVDDTNFTLGDIAKVTCTDATAQRELASLIAGISAPPSFSRYICGREFLKLRCSDKYVKYSFECSGAVRSRITTKHRVVRVDEFKNCIDSTLNSLVRWEKGSWEFSLLNPEDSLCIMARDVTAAVDVASEPFYPKGKENITLILSQNSRKYSMPLKVSFTVRAVVLVAKRDIPRGAVLTSDDYSEENVDITHFKPVPIQNDLQLNNKKAARSIRSGTIFHERLFKEIPVIEKGEQVEIVHTGKNITISIAGTAREAGSMGERIWVENGATGKLIRARITGKGIVALTRRGRKI